MLNTFWKQIQFEAENISKFDTETRGLRFEALSSSRGAKAQEETFDYYNAQSVQGYNASKIQGREARVFVLRKGRRRHTGTALVLERRGLDDRSSLPPYTIGEANVSGTDVSNVVKYRWFHITQSGI